METGAATSPDDFALFCVHAVLASCHPRAAPHRAGVTNPVSRRMPVDARAAFRAHIVGRKRRAKHLLPMSAISARKHQMAQFSHGAWYCIIVEQKQRRFHENRFAAQAVLKSSRRPAVYKVPAYGPRLALSQRFHVALGTLCWRNSTGASVIRPMGFQKCRCQSNRLDGASPIPRRRRRRDGGAKLPTSRATKAVIAHRAR